MEFYAPKGRGRGKKNFILQSEFMFPEESNPFSIVSLFLACSKLNERGHKNPDYLKIFPNRYFFIFQLKPYLIILLSRKISTRKKRYLFPLKYTFKKRNYPPSFQKEKIIPLNNYTITIIKK